MIVDGKWKVMMKWIKKRYKTWEMETDPVGEESHEYRWEEINVCCVRTIWWINKWIEEDKRREEGRKVLSR